MKVEEGPVYLTRAGHRVAMTIEGPNFRGDNDYLYDSEGKVMDVFTENHPADLAALESTLVVGVKADANKPPAALLPSGPLLEIARVLDHGAEKYTAHQWRKGFAYSRLTSAAMRHLLAWNEGEDQDPESGLSHLAHAAVNLMFLIEHTQRKLGEDDRYRHPPQIDKSVE